MGFFRDVIIGSHYMERPEIRCPAKYEITGVWTVVWIAVDHFPVAEHTFHVS
jgi:hypothetical protein